MTDTGQLQPAALLFVQGYREWRVVTSTFRLFLDGPGDDPIAIVLPDGLIDIAESSSSKMEC